MNPEFSLPDQIKALVDARNALRDHYKNGLEFTFDGKLVGDLGEAVAAEIFGLELKQSVGVDAIAPDGRKVQIKATTNGKYGPIFRYLKKEDRADILLFLVLDLDERTVEIVFNGPEEIALKELPDKKWGDQKKISPNKIRNAAKCVQVSQKLVPVNTLSPKR